MRKDFKRVSILFMILLTITACSGRSSPSLPTATEVNTATIEEVVQYDKHSESALTAYPRAEEDASRWNSEAVLYQIAPTRLMEQNLGLPEGPSGWFFMFKAGDSPVELYIEIVDGAVYGRTEAQPIQIEEPSYKLLPIDIDEVLLDSNEALAIFWTDGGKEYFTENSEVNIDYRLIYLDGQENPVWSIFDSGNLETPLYNVDAVTGEKVKDPFSS